MDSRNIDIGRYSIHLPFDNNVAINASGFNKYNTRYHYLLRGQFYCRTSETIDHTRNIELFFDILCSKSINDALNAVQGGSFSIVIVDHQSRTVSLLCDRYGLLPLYFALKEESTGLTLEISFDLDAWTDFQIDRASISEFIQYGCLLFAESMNTGVSRLHAGQCATVSSVGRLQTEFWYQREASNTQARPTKNNLIESVDEAFRTFFTKVTFSKAAIAGLSGGFDSRLIVSYLKEFGIRPIYTFTMGSKGSTEATIASKIAKILNVANFSREVPADIMATDGLPISRRFHLIASLELAHIELLRRMLAETLELTLAANYFDGFLGDVVMGGAYFSGPAHTISGMFQDILQIEYKLTPLRSIHEYVEIATNAKQRVISPLLTKIMNLKEFAPTIEARVLESLYSIYNGASSHQDMLNQMRLQQRGYRYIITGPRTLMPAAPVYLPFMDYNVRDTLDRIPLNLLARHRFYREFLRTKFPEIASVIKSDVGANATSNEVFYRLCQYGAGFMRRVLYPRLHKISAGRLKMGLGYANMQVYIGHPATRTWICDSAKTCLPRASLSDFNRLDQVSKLRILSLRLAGYSVM